MSEEHNLNFCSVEIVRNVSCSNPTNVVLVIVLSMIIGNGAKYWDRHKISGIRTRAIEIVSIFKMDLCWEKNMVYYIVSL